MKEMNVRVSLASLRTRFMYMCLLSAVYLIVIVRVVLEPSTPQLNCRETCLSTPYNRFSFENETESEDGRYIVPNYVHFLRYDKEELSFADVVCIYSALKNQKPDILFIHTNRYLKGKYWDVLMRDRRYKEVIRVKRAPLTQCIFGIRMRPCWNVYHAADFIRLRIIAQYGGIFLDNDVFVVRSLDNFRRFEMTIGWVEHPSYSLSNQAIIANRNARFLKMWLESFREYNRTQWYWNASIKPTREILEKNPHLIRREKNLLCDPRHPQNAFLNLLKKNWTEWRHQYAIHLLVRHRYLVSNASLGLSHLPAQWTDDNIKNYDITLKDMAYDVYPFK